MATRGILIPQTHSGDFSSAEWYLFTSIALALSYTSDGIFLIARGFLAGRLGFTPDLIIYGVYSICCLLVWTVISWRKVRAWYCLFIPAIVGLVFHILLMNLAATTGLDSAFEVAELVFHVAQAALMATVAGLSIMIRVRDSEFDEEEFERLLDHVFERSYDGPGSGHEHGQNYLDSVATRVNAMEADIERITSNLNITNAVLPVEDTTDRPSGGEELPQDRRNQALFPGLPSQVAAYPERDTLVNARKMPSILVSQDVPPQEADTDAPGSLRTLNARLMAQARNQQPVERTNVPSDHMPISHPDETMPFAIEVDPGLFVGGSVDFHGQYPYRYVVPPEEIQAAKADVLYKPKQKPMVAKYGEDIRRGAVPANMSDMQRKVQQTPREDQHALSRQTPREIKRSKGDHRHVQEAHFDDGSFVYPSNWHNMDDTLPMIRPTSKQQTEHRKSRERIKQQMNNNQGKRRHRSADANPREARRVKMEIPSSTPSSQGKMTTPRVLETDLVQSFKAITLADKTDSTPDHIQALETKDEPKEVVGPHKDTNINETCTALVLHKDATTPPKHQQKLRRILSESNLKHASRNYIDTSTTSKLDATRSDKGKHRAINALQQTRRPGSGLGMRVKRPGSRVMLAAWEKHHTKSKASEEVGECDAQMEGSPEDGGPGPVAGELAVEGGRAVEGLGEEPGSEVDEEAQPLQEE